MCCTHSGPVPCAIIDPLHPVGDRIDGVNAGVMRRVSFDRRALITRKAESANGSGAAGQSGLARGQRRDALIDAAERLFSRMPYSDVAISDIADEAGVAHGLLFYHFKDKHGIYLAVLTKITSEIIELWYPPADDETSPAEQLRGVLRRQIAYRQKHPQTALAMIRAGDHDADVHALLEQARQPGLNFVYDLLGTEGPPTPALRGAVRGCMGFLDELTADWIAHGNDLPPDDIEELAFRAIVAALSAVHLKDPGVAAVLRALESYEFPPSRARRAGARRSAPRRGAVSGAQHQ
ncbi:TetR/AcrR family transcriptional regulator [Nocardia sp. CA-129566]|uniref:TetR/AcrR family transcriptional regulator n=1 Tax=Nocardia sp. CA-129566 TaxID=3239976 RepID=UPI003D994518